MAYDRRERAVRDGTKYFGDEEGFVVSSSSSDHLITFRGEEGSDRTLRRYVRVERDGGLEEVCGEGGGEARRGEAPPMRYQYDSMVRAVRVPSLSLCCSRWSSSVQLCTTSCSDAHGAGRHTAPRASSSCPAPPSRSCDAAAMALGGVLALARRRSLARLARPRAVATAIAPSRDHDRDDLQQQQHRHHHPPRRRARAFVVSPFALEPPPPAPPPATPPARGPRAASPPRRARPAPPPRRPPGPPGPPPRPPPPTPRSPS